MLLIRWVFWYDDDDDDAGFVFLHDTSDSP